jgi:5'-3' exonuclease
VALFLIDGHALAYRAYFAFAGTPLTNSRGEETGAVYGFINTLLSIMPNHPVPGRRLRQHQATFRRRFEA